MQRPGRALMGLGLEVEIVVGVAMFAHLGVAGIAWLSNVALPPASSP